MRKRFLLVLLVVSGCLTGPVCAEEGEVYPPPNILLFMADDMGIGDTSAYLGARMAPGAPPIEKTLKTPRIEAFAQGATVFTHAYAPASMCSSTRYSLLTGRYAHRPYLKKQGWLPHGPNAPMIHQALTTLPEMLQASGYHTACIGKYHVGIAFDDGKGSPADDFYHHDVDFAKPLLDGPTHHGFDEYFGVPGNTEDSLDTEPRVFIKDDRFEIGDASRLGRAGMGRHEGKIIAAPDWDLSQIGPRYLAEAEAFLGRHAGSGDAPFFLYYVPNANHKQRNPLGDYAVPDEIAGVPIKGQSRYTDGTPGGERDDMVLENDVAFGRLLELLRTTDDPRRPGHPLIENTVVIFTSDNGPNVGVNEEPNLQSGGLRGKKARLWEGGIRVPFLLHLPEGIAGAPKPQEANAQVFSLTDLYATLARLVGRELGPHEAPDSHDSFAFWTGEAKGDDLRPRVFFCHLGPPYLNDALAIRQGRLKLVVDGGLAMPSMKGGSLGGLRPAVFYDLGENYQEQGNFTEGDLGEDARRMGKLLLEIHNRGYAREKDASADGGALLLDDGWHNLRNDVTGRVGFEFKVAEAASVTHLGMWDDEDKEVPARPPRATGDEHGRDRPSREANEKRRSLAAPHGIRLEEVSEGGGGKVLAEMDFPAGQPGICENEFRYLELAAPVQLEPGVVYRLTMTTRVGDGDQFHGPAAFDGLSPLVSPLAKVRRALLIRDGEDSLPQQIPAFSDMSEDYAAHRLPVGPTLKFASPR